MCVSELVLLQQSIDMKLGELEGALIHALFLHVIHISTMRNIQELMLNLLDRERCELFQTKNKCLMVFWERLLFEFLLNIEEDLAGTDYDFLVVLALPEGI